jgi:hypothetical protein
MCPVEKAEGVDRNGVLASFPVIDLGRRFSTAPIMMSVGVLAFGRGTPPSKALEGAQKLLEPTAGRSRDARGVLGGVIGD